MVFPLIKLGYLAVKQLSKPLVRMLREKAKSSPFFRTYVIIPPAQIYHKIETMSKMHLLGLGKPSHVEKLNEAMAIELGSDLLGELVIFLIAVGTLSLEYIRSSKSQSKKDDELAFKFKQLSAQIHELGLYSEKQNFKIRELERTLGQYHSDHQNFLVKTVKNIVKTMPQNNNEDNVIDYGEGNIIFEPIVKNQIPDTSIYDITGICNQIIKN